MVQFQYPVKVEVLMRKTRHAANVLRLGLGLRLTPVKEGASYSLQFQVTIYHLPFTTNSSSTKSMKPSKPVMDIISSIYAKVKRKSPPWRGPKTTQYRNRKEKKEHARSGWMPATLSS
jgi:hypothetical protein